MEAEVRVIQLIRKTIWNENNLGDTERTGTNDYFATDYFDIMRVERKALASPLTSIMGIGACREIDDLDIAVHSYSLYLSKKMAELAYSKEKCGDPFEDPHKKMPFLSIIQVHIIPEILARRPEGESAEKFIEVIYQDLLDAMGEYADSAEHRNETFVFCIYKMLSSGDFAVVVRGDEPEISFAISTLLRRRVTADKEIVLYKTYTIFTFGDEVIERETDESLEKSAEDRFVLRCCFSHSYWSNKEKVDLYRKNEKLHFEDRMYGLNGRYDFSVRVTKKQFFELFQDIKTYKQIKTKGSVSGRKIDENRDSVSETDDIVKYMRYLMDNHYLSYINERYLMAQNEDSEESVINSMSTVRCAGEARLQSEYLDQKTKKRYHSVKERYERVCGLIGPVAVSGKNIRYYMDLLGKQINFYYGINGFSDTRIYAAALLEQLDVVLGSIEEYIGMYDVAENVRETEGEEAEKDAIRNLFEDYMRQSVCALDNYAQYVRSRNLQSLQTPNYNLESNMSLEKMLIGYSEFIKVFMDFYPRRFYPSIGGEQEKFEYFPVVVPALKDKDVSVETLFAKGRMNDWKREEKIRKEKNAGYGRSCIIIGVPTLMELGDVKTMAASLIHEMAHQFRYETREKRNDALLGHLIHAMMRDVTDALIQNIQNETGVRDWNLYFGRILEKTLVDAYMEINYRNVDGSLEYAFRDAPLNNFTYCFGKDFYQVLGSWEKKSEVRAVFRAFLKKLMERYQLECSRCPDAIKRLECFIETIEKWENGEALMDSNAKVEREVEAIVRYAYALSLDCACQKLNTNNGYIWEETGLDKWVYEQEKEIIYEDEWGRAFEENLKENDSSKELRDDIFMNFSNFASWVYDNCGNDAKVKPYNITKKTEFLKKAYKKMCQEWNGITIQEKLKEDYDSTFTVIGRTLGIDCETDDNKKIFEEKMTTVIVQNLKRLDEMANWRIRKYREETADMFMCNAMDLTPFGYMYQLAVGWLQDRELPNEYYSRSQNLLLFQWCLEGEGDNKKLSYRKYRELCVCLVKTLQDAIAKTAESLIKQGSLLDLPKNADTPLQWDDEKSKQGFEVQDRITYLKDYCDETMKKCSSECVKEEYRMLKLFGIMAHMMEQLVGSSKEHLGYLEDFDEIRNDYITGISKLQGLNQKMCEKEGENGIVSKLGKFCKEMGKWQNEPHELLGDSTKKERMTAYSIEFLLDMYYENKRRIANKIGGE